MLSMPMFSRFMLSLLLLLAPAPLVFAQDARIEQQMTPEQFKAAGLDQLTSEQLASLNDWLNRTIDRETTKAAEIAKKEVEDDTRGFFSFGSNEPVSARIAGEFKGYRKGRRYTLDNGQVWEQTDDARLPGVTLDNPEVSIAPGMFNVWYMKVDRYNTRAKVQRVE